MNATKTVPPRPGWPSLLLALGLAAGALVPATTGRAQTWTRTQNIRWNHAPNWSGGVLPANDGTADVTLGAASGDCSLDADWNVRSLTVTPNFRGTASAGTLRNAGNFTLVLQAGGVSNGLTVPLTLAANLDLRAAGTWADAGAATAVTGLLSGPGGIVKTGAGTLTLANAANTFAGGVSVLGGIVAVLTDGALGADAAPVDLNGGTLRYGVGTNSGVTILSPRPVRLGPDGGTLQLRGGTLTLQGTISGSAGLALGREPDYTTSTPRRFVLAAAHTYAGDTTVTAATLLVAPDVGASVGDGDVILGDYGVLSLGAASQLAAGRRVVLGPLSALALRDPGLDPAAILDPARTTGGFLALGTAPAWTTALDLAALGNGELFLGAGADVRYAAATLGPGRGDVYRLGGGVVNPAGGVSQLTISGHPNVLTGTARVVVGRVNIVGSPTPNDDLLTGGTVTLTEANDYLGGTTLAAGVLRVGHDGALGNGPLTLSGGRFGSTNATPRTVANPLVLDGSGTANNVAGGFQGPGPLRFTGPVNLGGSGQVLAGTGVHVTLAGPIANGRLHLGGGTWSLEAANPDATGFGISSYGTLRFREDANLGAATGTLSVGGGTVELAGDAAAEVTLNRPVNVTNAYSYVRVPAGKTLTLTGKLTVGVNTGGLGKLGPGTLVLTGRANVGPVSLNEGTLRVNHAGTGTMNPIVVDVFGSGTLAGTGLVGFTTVGRNARVAPGDAATPGTLRVGSGLRLNGGSHLDFRLGTAGADRLVLDWAHLFDVLSFGTDPKVVFVALADAGGLAPGQTYTLVDWNTSEHVSGVNPATFRLSAGPVGGTITVVDRTLQLLTAALTPYEAWQNRFFANRADPAAAPGAPSPAGDGVSNLLKYALGLDPTRPVNDAAGLPRVGTLPPGGDLSLTYTRAVAATDVSFTPQWSDDLATWQTDGITEETLSDDGTLRTVRARVPAAASGGRRFLRLRVTQP